MEAAVQALENWAKSCPDVVPLLKQAHALAVRSCMGSVAARAKTHGMDATPVVWSDARCPLREAGRAAVGVFSMDLRALCKQPSVYIAEKQHLHDLAVAATRPLHEVQMHDGRKLEDFLLDTIKVRNVPETAEVRVQGLVVYDATATIKLHTRRYRELQTHTFVFMPDGRYGFRTGNGEVGVAGKSIQLEEQAADGTGQATPSTLMVVTVWTDAQGFPPPMYSQPAATFRGLAPAQLSLGDDDVPDGDPTLLGGRDLLAVRVELLECHVAYGLPTEQQVDHMCRHVIDKQARLAAQPE
jgi:hypothetical protein